RTEGARCTSHEYFRPNKVAKPGKRNPSKRKSRRVAAQSDPVQRTEGITRLQRTRCGPDKRVHLNPATLVTPTVRYPLLICLMTKNQHVVSRNRPNNDGPQNEEQNERT